MYSGSGWDFQESFANFPGEIKACQYFLCRRGSFSARSECLGLQCCCLRPIVFCRRVLSILFWQHCFAAPRQHLDWTYLVRGTRLDQDTCDLNLKRFQSSTSCKNLNQLKTCKTKSLNSKKCMLDTAMQTATQCLECFRSMSTRQNTQDLMPSQIELRCHNK